MLSPMQGILCWQGKNHYRKSSPSKSDLTFRFYTLLWVWNTKCRNACTARIIEKLNHFLFNERCNFSLSVKLKAPCIEQGIADRHTSTYLVCLSNVLKGILNSAIWYTLWLTRNKQWVSFVLWYNLIFWIDTNFWFRFLFIQASINNIFIWF